MAARKARWQIAATTLIVLLFSGLALVGPARLASPALAKPTNSQVSRDEFTAACRADGATYVENADGSYECDFNDGGTIKCTDTTCWYIPPPRIAGVTGIIGAAGRPVDVNPGTVETPTPTKGNNGPSGVIRIGPPAGQPPLPGNRSGIALTLWDCPAALPALPRKVTGTPPHPRSDCSALDNVTNKAQFLVGGPGVQETTIHGGGINMTGMPAGKYLIRLYPPPGYGDPVGYCGFAPTEDQGPTQWSQVPIAGGSYTVELGQDQTIYCNWYVTYQPSRAPVNAAVATPASGPAATPVT